MEESTIESARPSAERPSASSWVDGLSSGPTPGARQMQQREVQTVDNIIDNYGVDSLFVRLYVFIEKDWVQNLLMYLLILDICAVIGEIVVVSYFPDPQFVVRDSICCVDSMPNSACYAGGAAIAPNVSSAFDLRDSRRDTKYVLAYTFSSLAIIALVAFETELIILVLALRCSFLTAPYYVLDLLMVSVNLGLQVWFVSEGVRWRDGNVPGGAGIVALMIVRLVRLTNAGTFSMRRAMRRHERTISKEVQKRRTALDRRREQLEVELDAHHELYAPRSVSSKHRLYGAGVLEGVQHRLQQVGRQRPPPTPTTAPPPSSDAHNGASALLRRPSPSLGEEYSTSCTGSAARARALTAPVTVTCTPLTSQPSPQPRSPHSPDLTLGRFGPAGAQPVPLPQGGAGGRGALKNATAAPRRRQSLGAGPLCSALVARRERRRLARRRGRRRAASGGGGRWRRDGRHPKRRPKCRRRRCASFARLAVRCRTEPRTEPAGGVRCLRRRAEP